jgi:hypothetical protein
MRSTPPLRSAPFFVLALLLAVLTALAAGPSAQATSVAPTQVARVTVSGCTAFSGARALGYYYYADAYVRVDPCGQRPSFDGARTGSGPIVRPYAGSHIYYRGYQCIELVARYLKVRYGADPGVANGAQAVDRYAAAYPTRFVRIANGTVGSAPRKGDVLSLSAHGAFDDVGHTGIVISATVSPAGNGTVRAVEENWGGTGGARGYHNYTMRNWRLVFAALPYVKWLRAR